MALRAPQRAGHLAQLAARRLAHLGGPPGAVKVRPPPWLDAEHALAVEAPRPEEDHHRLLQEGRDGPGSGSESGPGPGPESGQGQQQSQGLGQGQGHACRKAMQAESAKSTALR